MFALIVLATLALCHGFPQSLDTKIVNGENALIENHPYQISIFRFNHYCGGSLLNASLVLTAAHCTMGRVPSDFYIYAGFTEMPHGPSFQKPDKIFQHPDFDINTVDNDIALMTLRTPFKLSDKIKPIALPSRSFQLPVGAMATVTGYGKLSEGGASPAQLQKLDVEILSDAKCNSLYGAIDKQLTPHMFCAGYEQGGKDSCQGDSGGPIVNNNVQIGIVSWGYGCARPGFPGVYTKISTLLDFIESSVGTIQNGA